MSFKRTPQKFSAAINEVTLGVGEKAVKIGGENVLPLYTFDAPIANRPAVGAEITDLGFDSSLPALSEYYAGCSSIGEIAKRASEMPGADFLAVSFEGASPDGLNKSVEECVEVMKEIAAAVDVPIVVEGCKNMEKDLALFDKLAAVLEGRNALFLSAREEDYKTVAASVGMAYGQKVGAESAVDINLAKQLNVLITQLGIQPGNIVMNVGSASAGYGFEYVVSTMDRVRGAALTQDDKMLQMPIITPVSSETWNVKESIVAEEDMPEWGSREERGINMEICTASACLASGSNAVILKHPASVATIAELIGSLI